MFVGSGNFWDNSLSWFLNILKLLLFYSDNFQIFKTALEQFIPNRPPKHVITCTKHTWYNGNDFVNETINSLMQEAIKP